MIKYLMDAWKYGNQLKDPASWKIGAMLSTAVGGLLVALMGVVRAVYPEFELPVEVQEYATNIICALLAIINIYIHKASSEKV